MKTKILICLGALLAVAAAVNRMELPAAKVTVKVIDEEKKPVAQANVWFGFKDRLTGKDVAVRGLTDADGLFTGEGGADAAGIGCSITSDGYYMSGAPIPKFSQVDTALNRWKPWGETYTTTLRPVGKPVALYAKRLRKLELPALDQPCGYDLEKGDWVAPYGQGNKADFIFTGRRESYTDWFNFAVQVDLAFSQSADGLARMSSPDVAQFSTFHWEREAPENGYVGPHHIRFVNRDPRTGQKAEISFDADEAATRKKGYFFRVRTVEKDGRIIAANYGKIVGDIGIDARDTKTCYVYFTYYFNPTSLDRNLEWDTKRNLLSGLKDEEIPRQP